MEREGGGEGERERNGGGERKTRRDGKRITMCLCVCVRELEYLRPVDDSDRKQLDLLHQEEISRVLERDDTILSLLSHFLNLSLEISLFLFYF